MTDVYADVTLHVPDEKDKINALHRKAREVDEEQGVDKIPDEYTLAQALQVVWHHDPDWLHHEFLIGWTLDAAGIEFDHKQPVWKDPNE